MLTNTAKISSAQHHFSTPNVIKISPIGLENRPIQQHFHLLKGGKFFVLTLYNLDSKKVLVLPSLCL